MPLGRKCEKGTVPLQVNLAQVVNLWGPATQSQTAAWTQPWSAWSSGSCCRQGHHHHNSRGRQSPGPSHAFNVQKSLLETLGRMTGSWGWEDLISQAIIPCFSQYLNHFENEYHLATNGMNSRFCAVWNPSWSCLWDSQLQSYLVLYIDFSFGWF